MMYVCVSVMVNGVRKLDAVWGGGPYIYEKGTDVGLETSSEGKDV